MQIGETAGKILGVLLKRMPNQVLNYTLPYSNGNGAKYIAIIIEHKEQVNIFEALFNGADRVEGVRSFSYLWDEEVEFVCPVKKEEFLSEQFWKITFYERTPGGGNGTESSEVLSGGA